MSDPEVMARIGNRAIKTVEKKSNSEYSVMYKEINQTSSKLKLIYDHESTKSKVATQHPLSECGCRVTHDARVWS